jgi:hypothetical protein
VLRHEGHARLLLQPTMNQKFHPQSSTSKKLGRESQRDVREHSAGEVQAPQEAEEPPEPERRQARNIAVERSHRCLDLGGARQVLLI